MASIMSGPQCVWNLLPAKGDPTCLVSAYTCNVSRIDDVKTANVGIK